MGPAEHVGHFQAVQLSTRLRLDARQVHESNLHGGMRIAMQNLSGKNVGKHHLDVDFRLQVVCKNLIIGDN